MSDKPKPIDRFNAAIEAGAQIREQWLSDAVVHMQRLGPARVANFFDHVLKATPRNIRHLTDAELELAQQIVLAAFYDIAKRTDMERP